MKIAKAISLIGAIAMGGSIAYGFIVGDFAGEGSELLSMPWGIVSLVDLYVGFTLFSLWIVYRERSLSRSLVWIFFMMTLGSFTASVYAFLALHNAEGDWEKVWHGSRITL